MEVGQLASLYGNPLNAFVGSINISQSDVLRGVIRNPFQPNMEV